MKPFPKYLSILAILAAIFGALNTADILTLIGPPWASLIATVATITAALSHSLTGTGGEPQP